jgi:hypothetical protein
VYDQWFVVNPSTGSKTEDDIDGNSTAAIAGGAVGGILALILVAGIIIMVVRRKRVAKRLVHLTLRVTMFTDISECTYSM